MAVNELYQDILPQSIRPSPGLPDHLQLQKGDAGETEIKVTLEARPSNIKLIRPNGGLRVEPSPIMIAPALTALGICKSLALDIDRINMYFCKGKAVSTRVSPQLTIELME